MLMYSWKGNIVSAKGNECNQKYWSKNKANLFRLSAYLQKKACYQSNQAYIGVYFMNTYIHVYIVRQVRLQASLWVGEHTLLLEDKVYDY